MGSRKAPSPAPPPPTGWPRAPRPIPRPDQRATPSQGGLGADPTPGAFAIYQPKLTFGTLERWAKGDLKQKIERHRVREWDDWMRNQETLDLDRRINRDPVTMAEPVAVRKLVEDAKATQHVRKPVEDALLRRWFDPERSSKTEARWIGPSVEDAEKIRAFVVGREPEGEEMFRPAGEMSTGVEDAYEEMREIIAKMKEENRRDWAAARKIAGLDVEDEDG